MEPFIAPGRYVNYLDDDETGESVPAAYGPNYRRLREIKAKYDPGNLFHMNQNIRPLTSSEMAAPVNDDSQSPMTAGHSEST